MLRSSAYTKSTWSYQFFHASQRFRDPIRHLGPEPVFHSIGKDRFAENPVNLVLGTVTWPILGSGVTSGIRAEYVSRSCRMMLGVEGRVSVVELRMTLHRKTGNDRG